MSRQQKILKTKDNKSYYKTVLLPPIERDITDIYIISQYGDTLDKYADKYYNNVNDWYIIAHVNQIGKGSRVVPPGIQIRIPRNTTEIKAIISNINNKRL